MKPYLTILLCSMAAWSATPAETAIAQGLESVRQQPAYYGAYNALAMAYARRARETADARFYAQAEETLRQSFALAPENYDGLKVKTWLELGRQEFASARDLATKLNHMVPDDVAVYGYLADANAELGDYGEAVKAAQWMLDLRPGNVPALVRASYLRELHGKLPGASELMQMAYDATMPAESEDRAWMLTQLAHLDLESGDAAKAETHAAAALALYADYPYALTVLAQVRTAEGRYADAVELLAKRCAATPRAENLYALAEAQELAGHKQQADATFGRFEQESLAESQSADNSNHQLAAYYADHAKNPAKALEIARRELARRHDVYTLDAYAWALACNGELAAADSEMTKALATGVKDPMLLYHAGWIALRLGQKERAKTYLQDAAAGYSEGAAKLLASLI